MIYATHAFACMPINLLHSIVLHALAIFPLMSFSHVIRTMCSCHLSLSCIDCHLQYPLPCSISLNLISFLFPSFRMATKKGKEKATSRPPTRRGTKRALVAEPSSTAVKLLTKRVKRIIKVDEKEKAFLAKDAARFPNRYCEQMFPILAERNYNNEYLLILPSNIAAFVEPQIERRQWGFLRRQPRQVNLSWVVEFYSNFYIPTLQSIYVRQKQVPITEEAIQQVLSLPPIPAGMDAFLEATL